MLEALEKIQVNSYVGGIGEDSSKYLLLEALEKIHKSS